MNQHFESTLELETRNSTAKLHCEAIHETAHRKYTLTSETLKQHSETKFSSKTGNHVLKVHHRSESQKLIK